MFFFFFTLQILLQPCIVGVISTYTTGLDKGRALCFFYAGKAYYINNNTNNCSVGSREIGGGGGWVRESVVVKNVSATSTTLEHHVCPHCVLQECSLHLQSLLSCLQPLCVTSAGTAFSFSTVSSPRLLHRQVLLFTKLQDSVKF